MKLDEVVRRLDALRERLSKAWYALEGSVGEDAEGVDRETFVRALYGLDLEDEALRDLVGELRHNEPL